MSRRRAITVRSWSSWNSNDGAVVIVLGRLGPQFHDEHPGSDEYSADAEQEGHIGANAQLGAGEQHEHRPEDEYQAQDGAAGESRQWWRHRRDEMVLFLALIRT